MISLVIALPFIAVIGAVPVAWEWGITWEAATMAIGFYLINMVGVTVGFHRLFTHRSFEAERWLRITLAIAGALAVHGPILRWVADHRRHHAFADRAGDPHSPWRYGTGFLALFRGMIYAHMGWFYDHEETNQKKFVPDLLADPDIRLVDRASAVIAAISFLLPGVIAYAIRGSLDSVLIALFWASLIRIFLVHHVSWSVNSICHTVGVRPHQTRDRSTNFWPLAVLSLGDSWHNAHHAVPTSARHGAPKQLDIAAYVIALFERAGWATNVKWPTPRMAPVRDRH